ncbi:MAG: hypothetical protein EPN40_04985 [Rhodanobacteraceae bacterium]|nr:MAG: hypothetical protein EPN40_04985 [Rhodanobacteraceae bacterium]
MNTQKLIAIVVAIAINCAVLAWFHAWSNAAIASATPPANAQKIVTLPVINVHPSTAQLRELQKSRTHATPDQADAGGLPACIVMPYYSFAAQCDASVSG